MEQEDHQFVDQHYESENLNAVGSPGEDYHEPVPVAQAHIESIDYIEMQPQHPSQHPAQIVDQAHMYPSSAWPQPPAPHGQFQQPPQYAAPGHAPPGAAPVAYPQAMEVYSDYAPKRRRPPQVLK